MSKKAGDPSRAPSLLGTQKVIGVPMASETLKQTEEAENNIYITLKQRTKRVLLFYCTESLELARKCAAQSDLIQLQSINWRSPAVIFEHLSVIYALPRLFVASFTLVLPFFPTGSFERMEEEGDVATAFTMARILSNIPISRGGPTSLVIYDIHALQERFYFGDQVLPCFETGIPLLKQRLHQLANSDKIVVAFPDDGAWKRFHKLLDDFPMVVCNKVRGGDKRIVRLKEGNPSGCLVVIVDDLVQSGGTIIECQNVLADNGAAIVSTYVTHAVFPKQLWERFIHKGKDNPDKAFTYFWITDSCPLTVKAIANNAPF